MSTALNDVLAERQAQDRKWGDAHRPPEIWIAILAEELGEVARALLQSNKTHYRTELTQVAASAIAAIEDLDKHLS